MKMTIRNNTAKLLRSVSIRSNDRAASVLSLSKNTHITQNKNIDNIRKDSFLLINRNSAKIGQRNFSSWVTNTKAWLDPSMDYYSVNSNNEKNNEHAENESRTSIETFLKPRSIAVVGATERQGSVGRTLVTNLMQYANNNNTDNTIINDNAGFSLHLVNPVRNTIFEKKTYKSLLEIETPVDLAVVVTPASTVPKVVQQAVDRNIPSVLVISAGFKEIGEVGVKAENEMIDIIRRNNGKSRIIGPNCLGVMNPNVSMNATFACDLAQKGNIAFISQSGAMCTAVLDWSLKKNIGFSAFISIGSMVDVSWGDLIEYLGSDPLTSSILIYMESIGDAKSFLTAAKQVALSKPIIVIKAGKSPEAASAAASHTGSLAGSYDVFEAAMKRVGVLVVDTIGELFSCAMVLGKQGIPKGDKLLVVTNAGGPAVLATDAVVMGGASMATLEDNTIQKLDQFLPSSWSRGNPLDILGDANAATYGKTLEIALADRNADAVLVCLSPQDVTDPTESARSIIEHSKLSKKPILAAWMGGERVAEGSKLLDNANIPVFETPDDAASTFARICKLTKTLEAMYEVPKSEIDISMNKQRKERAQELIKSVRDEGRLLLTEDESKKLLEVYGLPVIPSKVCTTKEEAISTAQKYGFPVVLKLHSKVITHKADVGGVRLNLQDSQGVQNAYEDIEKTVTTQYGHDAYSGVSVQKMAKLTGGVELIIGSKNDNQFGPVVVFGSGGTYVEIYKDTALGIPPFNTTHAQLLIKDTKIHRALKGGQGKRFLPVDMKALEASLVKFSEMVVELTDIKECDINPMLASGKELLCLDARVLLSGKNEVLTKSAIREYPSQYVQTNNTLSDGTKVTIRPMHAGDERKLLRLHSNLSEESIRQRYFQNYSFEERSTRHALIATCSAPYDKLIATLALEELTSEPLGICRLERRKNNPQAAELKFGVIDSCQEKTLGSILMKHIVKVAKEEKISVLHASFLKNNHLMQKILEKFNFKITYCSDTVCTAQLDIQ